MDRALKTGFGTLGAPPDGVALAAIALAGLALGLACSPRVRARLRTLPLGTTVAALGLTAVLASWGYVAFYLRGGPRIIDATSYFLQARALSEGYLAFPALDPSGSLRGRFLISTPDAARLSVIFPPGWPALLAVGFVVGAPLAVAPVVGGLLVLATAWLALRATGSKEVALVAASLSVLSATLRYHTADTMSHGLAALLFTAALALGLGSARRDHVLAGSLAGWLVATRPVSGLVLLLLLLLLLRGARPRVALLLGTIPGVALLLAHQHAATGEFFGSTQLRYYALSDGPPGCFRYGFGAGIGCLFEHGEVVAARGGAGHGPLHALWVTLLRLRLHAQDLMNFEPSIVLLAVAGWRARRNVRLRWLAIAPPLIIAAYAPFYFDGSYPGGGGRLFADVLPVEQVLLAWGAVELGLARWLPGVALGGFALHGAYDHRNLADREGGRPMYEPDVVTRAGLSHGLIFVDTDHGFALGHDPGASVQHGVVVARYRGDAHDALLWDALGRPATLRYRFDPFGAHAEPTLTRYDLEHADPPWRFEAEAEWPVLDVREGSAFPAHVVAACASQGRGLRLMASGGGPVVIRVAGPRSREVRRVTARWIGYSPGEEELGVRHPTARVRARHELAVGECWDQELVLGGTEHVDSVEVSATGVRAVLDFVLWQ